MFFTDATYQKLQKSSDTEINKQSYYAPYNRHIVKLMTVCTILPKVNVNSINIDYISVYLKKWT